MKYKFEKSKYPIFKIAFWILLFCSIFLFLMIAKNNAYFFNIKNYSPILKPITANVEFSRQVNDKIFICFDDYCKPLEQNSLIAQKAGFSYIESASFSEEDEMFFKTKIKNVYLALPKNMKNQENKIKKIDLYIANKAHYYDFSNIKTLKNKTVPLVIGGDKKAQEYVIYAFENSNNYVGIKNHLMTIALSFLLNAKLYTFAYCWLGFAILIFLFNKDAFKYSTKTKSVILLSFVFAISFVILLISVLLPKDKANILADYISNDIKNYSESYKIHIISTDNKDSFKNFKDLNIVWHYIESPDKKINKIEKEEFVKNNEKTIIYFDSDSADIGSLSIFNARAKIYYTNNGAIGKITYN